MTYTHTARTQKVLLLENIHPSAATYLQTAGYVPIDAETPYGDDDIARINALEETIKLRVP